RRSIWWFATGDLAPSRSDWQVHLVRRLWRYIRNAKPIDRFLCIGRPFTERNHWPCKFGRCVYRNQPKFRHAFRDSDDAEWTWTIARFGLRLHLPQTKLVFKLVSDACDFLASLSAFINEIQNESKNSHGNRGPRRLDMKLNMKRILNVTLT